MDALGYSFGSRVETSATHSRAKTNFVSASPREKEELSPATGEVLPVCERSVRRPPLVYGNSRIAES